MPAAEAAALADDDLGPLFSLFATHPRVLLAVSGGADSVALLVLACRWRDRQPHAPELIAVTVDHGLRAGSAAEARAVGVLAAGCGIAHRILRWPPPHGRGGLEAAAREGRYALLFEAARAMGATAVATAHTLDDQAETVLMRLAAGSGPAGLAAMRQTERRAELMLLRPLLMLPKARLVASLQREGIAWAEDPMNRDPAFARARLRASAAILAREGLTPGRLARLAKRLARWEAALSAASLAASARFRMPGGEDVYDARAMAGAPEEFALRTLAAEIERLGREVPPHGVRLERLEALWEALQQAVHAGQPLRRTLAGALVALDAAGCLRVTPAAPRRRTTPKTSESLGAAASDDRQLRQG